MNTTAQGDDLEGKVYAILKQEINAGRLLLRSDCCKLFQKKGYYSKDREKNIVFDISIEATIPGETQYSLLILIECKSYGRPVPVDDAEEFFSKIDQVGGANVKGVIASTNSFQDGTIRYARSKGIGLLRYYSEKTLKWELPRSPSTLVSSNFAQSEWVETSKGLSVESHEAKYFDIYTYAGGSYTTALKQFILNLIGDESEKMNGFDFAEMVNPVEESSQLVPYRDVAFVEDIVQRVLERIGYLSGPVNLDSVLGLYKKQMGLRFILADPPNDSILGRIRFSPLEIHIYPDNHTSIHRQRFTIAHELGHLAMSHSDYMYGEYCESTDTNLEQPSELGVKDLVRMEWQANAFASCLLLPRRRFLADFLRISKELNIRDRGFGLIYLDSQPVNRDTFRFVSSRLKHEYQVSRAAIKIRLKQLGYLTEAA